MNIKIIGISVDKCKDIINILDKAINEPECICNNCKYWDIEDESLAKYYNCYNSVVNEFPRVSTPLVTPPTFGCNQWKVK